MPNNDKYLTPRKLFQFRVTIFNNTGQAPLEPFAVQSITFPESSIEAVEHGHGNTKIKTGGQVTVGNLTLNRILDAGNSGLSAYFWSWHNQIQDALLNAGGLAIDYKGSILIEELGAGSIIPPVVGAWEFTGVWPMRIGEREYDRTSSDNVIESIEFSVDFMGPPPALI
jgi:hypothetical protein